MAYAHKWKTEKRPSECANPIDYTKKYIVYVIYVIRFVMAFIIKDVNEKKAKTRNDVTHQTWT